jgi:ABC-type glycerol-3-phosphate transport system permease component
MLARRGSRLPRLAVLGFIWLWVLFGCFLLVWTAMNSLKSDVDIFTRTWAPPELPLHFENYVTAWTSSNLASAAINTILVVVVSTALIVGISAPAAYALTRLNLPAAEPLTIFFAIGIGIPGQAILIPLFLMLAKLQLVNTLPGLALVYISLSLPFTVFLLTGFLRTLPADLEEAASIDGASTFQAFWQIMLPLARPGLITAAILNAVALSSEFLFALVLFNFRGQTTLPVAIINTYSSLRYTGAWGALFAEIVIVCVPVIFAYAWLSNRIIEGLTLGRGR